ncbi:TPA: energy-coupling factor transporter transmembrane component T family protein [Haemophilus influenzae]|uniref:energy-coupling factor transporter transmembrane component T family protein n=1 Tax=Haemophilus influenzae TaxID=727 RepID=UPI000D022056|nr:energy-coupling factor transporter transmembrane protein EcfT [Haemophilus influenzae]AXP38470.1 energy-coupling factor transporter transmembrane protein EcfT [Haemophilus influenzae]AXP67016.1 energy-coupling factor transporter transmembrane protein EcfT [Haemophilus influenzae]AYO35088.1 energy-coupling factor transporter transmembrane protein EcfT [Haemophilus influenzae]MCK8938698.1 energy-coupling factor transporter transmembrane protein EcfT [Haemophilus influenzae]MCK9087895.1 energy
MKIHRLFQPHFRLIYLFIWGLIISGLNDLTWLIPLNVFAVSLFFISLQFSQKSFLPYLKRWFALVIFIALMWATLSWQIGENGIELNFQGIELAEKLSLRTHLLLISLWLFLWNINDAVLVQAIGKLPLPEKLIQLFVLTVRYIALLGELRQKMDIAMRARGFRPGLNRRTLYVTAQSVALLLIHALLKAETAQMALKCRGFQFGKKREK